MPIIYLTEDKTSWVLYEPNWYSSTQELVTEMDKEKPIERHTIKIYGREVKTPRYLQAYGVDYRFSGTTSKSKSWTEPLLEMRERVIERLSSVEQLEGVNINFNMCLVNWYDTGEHYISPHSDDEKQFVGDTAIAGVSWGGTRTFVLTPIKSVKGHQTVKLDLNDGDLVVMGGRTQKTHRHGIPKSSSRRQRISFTFRVFKGGHLPPKSEKRRLSEEEEITEEDIVEEEISEEEIIDEEIDEEIDED